MEDLDRGNTRDSASLEFRVVSEICYGGLAG